MMEEFGRDLGRLLTTLMVLAGVGVVSTLAWVGYFAWRVLR